MRRLLLKLCQPGRIYTWAELPPQGIDEQSIELAEGWRPACFFAGTCACGLAGAFLSPSPAISPVAIRILDGVADHVGRALLALRSGGHCSLPRIL
jgi:hypothetical protein